DGAADDVAAAGVALPPQRLADHGNVRRAVTHHVARRESSPNERLDAEHWEEVDGHDGAGERVDRAIGVEREHVLGCGGNVLDGVRSLLPRLDERTGHVAAFEAAVASIAI